MQAACGFCVQLQPDRCCPAPRPLEPGHNSFAVTQLASRIVCQIDHATVLPGHLSNLSCPAVRRPSWSPAFVGVGCRQELSMATARQRLLKVSSQELSSRPHGGRSCWHSLLGAQPPVLHSPCAWGAPLPAGVQGVPMQQEPGHWHHVDTQREQPLSVAGHPAGGSGGRGAGLLSKPPRSRAV